MALSIHPTAIIEPGAEIGPDATIGPYAFVGGKVRMGARCRLHPHAAVTGRTTLGSGNTVHPGAVLGGDPQDLKFSGEETELIVGDGNTFREGVTVNIGTASGGERTVIGNHCLLMACAHVAHDCRLGDRVVLANGVLLAGHIVVEDGAILSGLAAVHHFATIGRLSFVGGMSAVRQDVPPFLLMEGNPARPRRLNLVGLKRNGFSAETMAALKKVFRLVYRSNLTRSQALKEVAALDIYPLPEVQEIMKSFRASEAGRQGRALEANRTSKNGGMYAPSSNSRAPVEGADEMEDEEAR
ncbi:MAG: acyl-ACP--UDP-N-acetylglucosamine O-acyltransferase [Planctomycetota bacterium]